MLSTTDRSHGSASCALARALVLAVVIAAGACIDRREELPVWTCADEPRPPSWTEVSAAVMEPSCGTVACHSALGRRAGVVLDSPGDGYASLLGGDDPFVRPGEPARSRLVYLLAGVEVATVMPPDAPLPGAEIDLVVRWICAGAEDD